MTTLAPPVESQQLDLAPQQLANPPAELQVPHQGDALTQRISKFESENHHGLHRAALGMYMASKFSDELPLGMDFSEQLHEARPENMEELASWANDMRAELTTYSVHPELGVAELRRQHRIATGVSLKLRVINDGLRANLKVYIGCSPCLQCDMKMPTV